MAGASPRIAVLDYGAGNIRSVAKAVERSGAAVDVCSDASGLRHADAVVFPGVGAFADAARSLAAKELDVAVREGIAEGRLYLGLCLGLQLLFEDSDEHGDAKGLGVLPGRVRRFPERGVSGERLLVPHIGWNRVVWSGSHPMLGSLPEEDVYYFVHSYRAEPADPAHIVGTTDYDGVFTAAVAKENVFAVQFHPEKSQRAGKRLIDAFVGWVRS